MDRSRCRCDAAKLRAMRHGRTGRVEIRDASGGALPHPGDCLRLGQLPANESAPLEPESFRRGSWSRQESNPWSSVAIGLRLRGQRSANRLYPARTPRPPVTAVLVPRGHRAVGLAERRHAPLHGGPAPGDTRRRHALGGAFVPGAAPWNRPASASPWNRRRSARGRACRRVAASSGERTASNKKRGPERVCPLWRTALNTTILRRPNAASTAGRTGQDRCAKRGATSV